MQLRCGTGLHPAYGTAFLVIGQVATIHRHHSRVAGRLQTRVALLVPIAVEHGPGKWLALIPWSVQCANQLFELLADDLTEFIVGNATGVTLALPFLASRALQLIALLFGIRAQAKIAEFFQRTLDLWLII